MGYRLLTLLSFAVAVLVATLVGAAPQRAATAHRAGIVVQFGDGHVDAACVAFSGPSISGFDLLQQSRLQVVAQTDGGNAIVCKIDQQGCTFPSEACFCQCPGGGPCHYWAYWHLAGGHWQFSPLGASSSEILPGGVDGWSWGNGTVAGGVQPPLVGFDQICPASAPATSVVPTRSRPAATSQHTSLPPTLIPTRPLVLPTANILPPPSPTPKIPPHLTASPAAKSATPILPAGTTVLPATETVLPAATNIPPPTQQPMTEAPALLASQVASNDATVPAATQAEIRTTFATTTALVAGEVIQRSAPAVTSSWSSYLFFGLSSRAYS